MGRYSSVQAFADNNPNMRAVDYSQAAGTEAPKLSAPGKVVFRCLAHSSIHHLCPANIQMYFYMIAVKTEKVENPYGSVAGAGSGEFHVYRHARSREMERWKKLDEEERQQELDAEFKKKMEASETEEELKAAQRRKKRQRQKEAKQRKHNLRLAGVDIEKSVAGDADEFSYTPIYNEQGENKEEVGIVVEEASKLEFANDGSFLEMMKKQLAEKIASDQRQNADDEPPAKKRAAERNES